MNRENAGRNRARTGGVPDPIEIDSICSTQTVFRFLVAQLRLSCRSNRLERAAINKGGLEVAYWGKGVPLTVITGPGSSPFTAVNDGA
jgi:hypothetical protein